MLSELELVLQKNKPNFHKVVPFEPANDKLHLFDFTADNKELTADDIADTEKFSRYISKTLKAARAAYGIGGYKEDRILYKRSNLFDTVTAEGKQIAKLGEAETLGRTIHLGVDIWGPAGTPVYLPLGGMVHSLAYNENFGDYGATIIVQHQLDTISFHTLYGHVSLTDLAQLHDGKYISRGEIIAHFGKPHENGNWPPHLHFQVIGDMDLKEGDYPGVCSIKESDKYFRNCPDADLILNMLQYVDKPKS